MNKTTTIIALVFGYVLGLAISLLPAWGIVWVLSLFTSVTVCWKTVFAAWIVIAVLKLIFKPVIKTSKN